MLDDDTPPTPTSPDTPHGIRSALLELGAIVNHLVDRVGRLERIERRLNYPVIGLLGGILATLLYIAHRLP